VNQSSSVNQLQEGKSMKRNQVIRILAVVAMAFGVLTIFSAAGALFGGDEKRSSLGHVVGFVLWFNFFAGFVYVLTGAGLWLKRGWAPRCAIALAVATGAVAVAFGLHISGGGAYEMRTVGALLLRLFFWVVVAAMAWRSIRAAQ
jgi:hypothetical protein